MEMLQPKLRFPEFERDWERKSFKEIYSFRSTNSFSRDKLNYERGIIKNIHYGDIHSKFNSLFDVKKEHVPFINEEISIDRISVENYLKVKDLIIADASEDYDDIGKCIEIINLSDEKVLAGLHTFVARPDLSEMSLGFGNYLMKSEKIKLQIKTIAQGTKVLSLSATRLSDVQLDLPSFQEQTKIAKFLSSIDEKINLLKEKKALLEEYKKGMMQKIFNQEIRFKDENGNNFEQWEEKSIGNILSIGSGRDYKHLNSGNVPVYGTGGLMTHVDSFLHQGETVCIGRKGTIDKPMYFNGDIWTVDTLFYTHTFIDSIPKYVFYVFQSINWKQYNEASGVPSLSKSTIEQISINLPPVAEQIKIANFLSVIDEKITLIKTQVKDSKEYKKGLLQQMFV